MHTPRSCDIRVVRALGVCVFISYGQRRKQKRGGKTKRRSRVSYRVYRVYVTFYTHTYVYNTYMYLYKYVYTVCVYDTCTGAHHAIPLFPRRKLVLALMRRVVPARRRGRRAMTARV